MEIYSKGLRHSELSNSRSIQRISPNSLPIADVEFVVQNSLEYSGQKCNDDENYSQDECRLTYMHKVNFPYLGRISAVLIQ